MNVPAKRIVALYVNWTRGRYYVNAIFAGSDVAPRCQGRADSLGVAIQILRERAGTLGLVIIEVMPNPAAHAFLAVLPTLEPPVIAGTCSPVLESERELSA